MSNIAIIGSIELCQFKSFNITHRNQVNTPYGKTSATLCHGDLAGQEIIYLPRYDFDSTILPSKVNDLANVWALKESGVEQIISIMIASGIRPDMTPGMIVVPDQLIEYNLPVQYSYLQSMPKHFELIDFSYPFTQDLRETIINKAACLNLNISDEATYGIMEMNRWHTIAEVNRLERDGCDLAGFAGMPEAILARELSIEYAQINCVATRAAGRSEKRVVESAEIENNINEMTGNLHSLLEQVVTL